MDQDASNISNQLEKNKQNSSEKDKVNKYRYSKLYPNVFLKLPQLKKIVLRHQKKIERNVGKARRAPTKKATALLQKVANGFMLSTVEDAAQVMLSGGTNRSTLYARDFMTGRYIRSKYIPIGI